jgi:hypothetical protein
MWRDFFQKLEKGIAAPVVTPEMEEEFLKLQSKISMRKQMLSCTLGENFGMGDDVMKVLIECPSLDSLQNESPIKINSIKGQWHEAYIAMSKMLGQIKERKAEEAKKGKFAKIFGR